MLLHIGQVFIVFAVFSNSWANGSISCSLYFSKCSTALLADLGPTPGIFDNRNVSLSIWEVINVFIME